MANYKKNYTKKSYKELEEEIQRYSDNALKHIETYVQRPEQVIELANFMSDFYDYSARNTFMIHSQFEGAYAVGSFKKFSDAGFKVNKGEKALKIFVPAPVTVFQSGDEMKQVRYATEQEKARIKAGELKTKEIMRYKLGNVFDISQTNATVDDLPAIFPNRAYSFKFDGNTQKMEDALAKIGKEMNVPIRYMGESELGLTELGNAKGAYASTASASKEEIVLNPRFPKEEQLATTIHELTHAKLHKGTKLSASEKEFQAELSSYIVLKHFGMDTSERAIPYIAQWTKNGQKLEDRVTLLEQVHRTSKGLILDIQNQLTMETDPVKEKEIEPPKKKEEVKQQKNFVSKEQIQQAKAVSIIDFAEQEGLSVFKSAQKEYRLVDHDSLVIFPETNTFKWFSQDIQGDSIAFAQTFTDHKSLQDAVNYLNNGEFEQSELKERIKEPFRYNPTLESTSFKKARDYLVNERKIDRNLVQCLHKKGLIRQDKKNNVLFCWGENGKVVGVTEQGTIKTDKFPRGSWKGIQKNSETNRGFNFTIGQPKHLKFFESSIDALSYASLHKGINDTRFVSMEGLKQNTMFHYIEKTIADLGQKPLSISLCVDNDSAGRDFYEKLGGERLQNIKAEFPSPPEALETSKWDWNDAIKHEAKTAETHPLEVDRGLEV